MLAGTRHALAPRGLFQLPYLDDTDAGAWLEALSLRGRQRARAATWLGFGTAVLVPLALAALVGTRLDPDRRRHPDGRAPRPALAVRLGAAGLVVAGAAEMSVNATTLAMLQANELAVAGGSARAALSAVGQAIVVATFAAFVIFLLPQRLRRPGRAAAPGRPDARPGFLRTGTGRHLWEPTEGRVGIACSGGGVRSASFTLGALQSLRKAGVLRRAAYVTSVSGGSYTASALAIANGEQAGRADPPLFDPSSPEERWVRNRSNYLAPDLGTKAAGVARLLAGLGVNLVLIWLVLYVVARPVGWLISAPGIHPELRSREPIVSIVAQPQPLAISLEPLPEPDPNGAQFRIHVDFRPGVVELTGERLPDRTTTVSIEENRPGLGGIIDGRFSVIRQPDVSVVDPVGSGTVNARLDTPSLYVRLDPVVRYTAASVIDPTTTDLRQIQTGLAIVRPPEIGQRSGMTGRPDITVDPWMQATVGGLGLVAAAAYLSRVLFRPLRPRTRTIQGVIIAVATAGFGAAALVLILLPWSVEHIPKAMANALDAVPMVDARVEGDGWAWTDSVPAALGYVGLAAVALRAFLYRVAARSPLRFARWLAALIVPAVGYFLLVQLIQFAAANGPTGRLAGFGLGVQPFPDWTRWLAVCVLLLGLRHAADAHAWSLFPYYKRRLASAFAIRRAPEQPAGAEEIPYHEKPLCFTDHGRVEPGPTGRAGPQLVVCAAANLVGGNVVPPGRRSASFTFSSTEMGGPHVGWIRADQYWSAMAQRRQYDITVPAAMAISGAAVSPAMGRLSLGALGRLLAVLNVRLGVWLPHPQWVAAFIDHERHETDLVRGQVWKDRPGWPYLFREIVGRFRFADRYLYVTDGGHWENLGLVELLRRGCTEIYCLSAAGDGPVGFGTMAEAIALAREELGVEFDGLELSPLRPTIGSADAGARPKRQLLRRAARNSAPVPAAYAGQAYVAAKFSYPARLRADGRPVSGRILFVEAALTEDIPWDVQGYAESRGRFPDESTLDQFFDHRQFESYRRLGEFQMTRALASNSWEGLLRQSALPANDAKDPVEPPIDLRDDAADDMEQREVEPEPASPKRRTAARRTKRSATGDESAA